MAPQKPGLQNQDENDGWKMGGHAGDRIVDVMPGGVETNGHGFDGEDIVYCSCNNVYLEKQGIMYVTYFVQLLYTLDVRVK